MSFTGHHCLQFPISWFFFKIVQNKIWPLGGRKSSIVWYVILHFSFTDIRLLYGGVFINCKTNMLEVTLYNKSVYLYLFLPSILAVSPYKQQPTVWLWGRL